MSTRRIIVERSIADEFTEKLVAKTAGLKVGDPKEHDTIIGPLINDQALSTVAARVAGRRRPRARRCSSAARRTGPATSRRSSTDVPADSRVRAARRRSARSPRSRSSTTRSEAVARANATGYGLSAGIITRRQPSAGFELASQIESGIVHVNDQTVGDEPQMPFGGVKDSRLGPLRRARRGGGVHRAAVGHRPGGPRHFPF